MGSVTDGQTEKPTALQCPKTQLAILCRCAMIFATGHYYCKFNLKISAEKCNMLGEMMLMI